LGISWNHGIVIGGCMRCQCENGAKDEAWFFRALTRR
jgi:hypothetical protein